MSIRVQDRFANANVRILRVMENTDGLAEVDFAPDPRGGPEALWFYFRVGITADDSPRPERLALTLRFFSNLLGASDPLPFRPVWREREQAWKRLPAPEVISEPDGQRALRWTINWTSDRIEIAFCYPYDRPELDRLLNQSKGYWTERAFGLTQHGRVLTRLDNGCEAAPGDALPHGVYLIARQHAGETPGSWVLDGILEAISRARLANWRVWAVPFADLDGVREGAYGKDAFPYDLNRAWGIPPMRHEVLAIQNDMFRWKARCRPDLVLDLHAPGACEASGMYAFIPDDAKDSQAHRTARAWANVIAQSLGPEYAADDFVRVARYASRWETPRLQDFVTASLGAAAVTIEVPYAVCGSTLMTARHYREAGRRIAKAVQNRRG